LSIINDYQTLRETRWVFFCEAEITESHSLSQATGEEKLKEKGKL
jgi:hypothetical protein